MKSFIQLFVRVIPCVGLWLHPFQPRTHTDGRGLLGPQAHTAFIVNILELKGKVTSMALTEQQKDGLKKELVACLSSDDEIKKIVVFGSFVHSSDPNDLDVAVFQESNEAYLPLAMKYRRKTRGISKKIALEIFPVRTNVKGHTFMAEIEQGEVLYER